MVEEWVKEARNNVKNEVHLHLEIEKGLGGRKGGKQGAALQADYRGKGKKEC